MDARDHKILRESLLLLALACAGATLGCSGSAPANAHAGGPPAMPVKVEVARATPVNDSTEYVATLKSRDSAVIMPQVEGQVTKIFVHSGEMVKDGAPLMEIDPLKQQATVKSQQSSLEAQQANLNWTKQQYERAQGLYSAGVVSKQDLDQAKSAHGLSPGADGLARRASTGTGSAAALLPGSGAAGRNCWRHPRSGGRPGHELDASLRRSTSLEVLKCMFMCRSIMPPQLKMNLPVQVLDSNDKVLANSRISFISPQVDNATQTILVKARIANSNDALRQSQFIRARIVWGTHDNPEVPILAVSRLAGQYFAFVAEPQNGGLRGAAESAEDRADRRERLRSSGWHQAWR